MILRFHIAHILCLAMAAAVTAAQRPTVGDGMDIPPIPTTVALPPASTTATLQWDWNPPTNSEPAASFNVYWGPAPRFYTNVISAGSRTSATISNISSIVTTYFAVTSVGFNGLESDYSAEISNDTPVRTNWITTYTWIVHRTNDLQSPMNFFRLQGTRDFKTWEPEPAIQTVTRTYW